MQQEKYVACVIIVEAKSNTFLNPTTYNPEDRRTFFSQTKTGSDVGWLIMHTTVNGSKRFKLGRKY